MTDLPAAPDQIRAVVRAVIALCPHRRALEPMVDEVARVTLVNDQMRKTFERIAERSRLAVTGRVERSDLGDDRAAVFMFLEHIRFACPAFLASVGEAAPEHPRA
jgi:hypothetical protein